MAAQRHKCFISYHHADQDAVNKFIDAFDYGHDVFIYRAIGIEIESQLIDSANTDYVMRRIRELYLQDSTVTILLCGRCTWARRYVDWELQSSLRRGETITPNGVLGIKLPTFSQWPDRFNRNLRSDGDSRHEVYGGWIDWPQDLERLQSAIEWAFKRRTTHASLIINPRERMGYNRQCP